MKYNIQITHANSRIPKYLKAHLMRGGKIVTTRHQSSARGFKSCAEAQEFIDKVGTYFHGTWTVVEFTLVNQLSYREFKVEIDGTIICFDCEENFPKEGIYGDARFSDPRCGDCYDSHKYERSAQ